MGGQDGSPRCAAIIRPQWVVREGWGGTWVAPLNSQPAHSGQDLAVGESVIKC